MELKDIENMQPWLMRIVKETGRGINRFKMIEDGDKVLLAISGGKDSLALAFTLAVRRRWLPIHYDLHAMRIDWNQICSSRALPRSTVFISHGRATESATRFTWSGSVCRERHF